MDDLNGNESKIRLRSPIVRQNAVVCRGTTCFETRNSHVAKFSWAPDNRKLEVDQIKLAEERGVEGVAEVVAHRQITSIAELRKGLGFPERHRFRNEDVHFDEPSSTPQARTRQAKSASHRPITHPTTRPDSSDGGPTVRSRSWSENSTTRSQAELVYVWRGPVGK